MAGIYIHIPFCKQKCHYCNFFSVASVRNKAAFLDALKHEMASRAGYLGGEKVNTVYFGGGTPSLLSAAEVTGLIGTLKQHFQVDPAVEITLEANPDDLSARYLSELAATEVNRLSIGVQSFFDDDLNYLNRAHNAAEAISALSRAQAAGFSNLTMDLIYGIPTLTDEKWLANIGRFLDTGINHLSAYALTVEHKTALHHLISKGRAAAVDEQQSARHFEMLMNTLQQHGFIHYEISNFARPGYYSKHNSIYWLGGHYVGLGPSAHSFNGHSRQWNVSNLTAYTGHAESQQQLYEHEQLSVEQQYNEYVMTSLRTSWGCDTEHILNVFGVAYRDYCLAQSEKHISSGHLFCDQHRLFLTNKGKLFADGIAADMFRDQDEGQ